MKVIFLLPWLNDCQCHSRTCRRTHECVGKSNTRWFFGEQKYHFLSICTVTSFLGDPLHINTMPKAALCLCVKRRWVLGTDTPSHVFSHRTQSGWVKTSPGWRDLASPPPVCPLKAGEPPIFVTAKNSLEDVCSAPWGVGPLAVLGNLGLKPQKQLRSSRRKKMCG